MSEKIPVLSADAIRELQDFYEWKKQQPSPRPKTAQDDSVHQAPEVYVAMMPGLQPAQLATLGTGTRPYITNYGFNFDDYGTGIFQPIELQGALCTIYKLTTAPGVLNPVLMPVYTDKLVYNLSDKILTGLVIVQRDKYGQWYASSGAGGEDLCTDINLVQTTTVQLTDTSGKTNCWRFPSCWKVLCEPYGTGTEYGTGSGSGSGSGTVIPGACTAVNSPILFVTVEYVSGPPGGVQPIYNDAFSPPIAEGTIALIGSNWMDNGSAPGGAAGGYYTFSSDDSCASGYCATLENVTTGLCMEAGAYIVLDCDSTGAEPAGISPYNDGLGSYIYWNNAPPGWNPALPLPPPMYSDQADAIQFQVNLAPSGNPAPPGNPNFSGTFTNPNGVTYGVTVFYPPGTPTACSGSGVTLGLPIPKLSTTISINEVKTTVTLEPVSPVLVSGSFTTVGASGTFTVSIVYYKNKFFSFIEYSLYSGYVETPLKLTKGGLYRPYEADNWGISIEDLSPSYMPPFSTTIAVFGGKIPTAPAMGLTLFVASTAGMVMGLQINIKSGSFNWGGTIASISLGVSVTINVTYDGGGAGQPFNVGDAVT